MLTSPQTPAAVLEQALPKNPAHGDVFVLPSGVYGGGTSSLELKHRTERIGFALSWAEVAGRPGLIHLNWVTSNLPLEEKLVVELVTTQRLFTSLRFTTDCGWQGCASRVTGTTSMYVRLLDCEPSCQGAIMNYERIYAKKIEQ